MRSGTSVDGARREEPAERGPHARARDVAGEARPIAADVIGRDLEQTLEQRGREPAERGRIVERARELGLVAAEHVAQALGLADADRADHRPEHHAPRLGVPDRDRDPPAVLAGGAVVASRLALDARDDLGDRVGELAREHAGRGLPIVGLLAHPPEHDVIERGELGPQLRRRADRVVELPAQDREVIALAPRAGLREHHVRGGGEAVDVRARRRLLIGEHLGRDEARRARRARVLAIAAGDPDVDQHAATAERIADHVRRLDVAVDDAALVERIERGRDLLDHDRQLEQRHRGPLGAVAVVGLLERLALDQLHHEVRVAARRGRS